MLVHILVKYLISTVKIFVMQNLLTIVSHNSHPYVLMFNNMYIKTFYNVALESRISRPVTDLGEFDKTKQIGAPLPLADRPIISRMMDRHLTLSWKPSIPFGPREPVTYRVSHFV